MTTLTGRPTALYRAFAADGSLLYVGIAFDPEARWRTHRWDKPWWSEVASTTTEWHPTEVDARRAEAVVVRDERPAYNRTLPAEDGSHRFRHTPPRVPCARSRASGPRVAVVVPSDLWGQCADALNSVAPDIDRSALLRMLMRWVVRDPAAAVAAVQAGAVGTTPSPPARRPRAVKPAAAAPEGGDHG